MGRLTPTSRRLDAQLVERLTSIFHEVKACVKNGFLIREVKIDVYGRPVTANAKLQAEFSDEVLAVRN